MFVNHKSNPVVPLVDNVASEFGSPLKKSDPDDDVRLPVDKMSPPTRRPFEGGAVEEPIEIPPPSGLRKIGKVCVSPSEL